MNSEKEGVTTSAEQEAAGQPIAASHLPSSGHRTPVSTYRIQLGPEMTFDDARDSLDYLERLGVTDIYLSPILQAAPGSTHGYDVVDPTRISESLGGREGFERLADDAHNRNIGVIVDLVPNHMGVPTPIYHNKALWSVLREGPNSEYAEWFDGTEDSDGILMPFLGERIGTALAEGKITLEEMVVPGLEDEGPAPVLKYYDHVFPVRAGTESLPLPMCVAKQYYRLAYWKVANEELNFRRFFDVDTLLAVRVEDPEVFQATHALLFDLYADGKIDGFRIDHIDGLADPRGYLRNLSLATGGAWVTVEKILEPDEELPQDWPTAGTTGYDASWRISQLQIDPSGHNEMAAVLPDIGAVPEPLSVTIEKSKREIATESLHAEVYRIADLAYQICHDDIMLRDHTHSWIQQCITELVIAFPRYRAYVVPGEPADNEAIRLVEEAAKVAATRLDPQLLDTLDVVVNLVLGREVGSASRAQQDIRDELVVRFQQTCGATTAKGVEDTAYYRSSTLIALNEVGGSPATWSLAPDDFHSWAAHQAAYWPAAMSAGSTHDNKRSEDVRERIGVLSQFAPQWRGLITQLHPFAEGVEPETENFLWQTLAGTWTDDGPIEIERLKQYMIKASREQQLWTTWTEQNTEAEQTMLDVIDAIYANEDVMGTLADWYKLTNPAARVAILSRKALQLTCPGVADTFNTCETTQNYLVDPDNRRPANFEELSAMLDHVTEHSPRTLAEQKMFLTARILRLRRRRPEVFVGPNASYRPLACSTGHVVAYARGAEAQVVTIAARLYRGIQKSEGFTDHTVVLPPGQWIDVLTQKEFPGGEAKVRDLLERFPCAVLENLDDNPGTETIAAIPEPAEKTVEKPDMLSWLVRRFSKKNDE
ncbi:malto-oligosyltrehalose synthase [Propionimicrobium sp. BV2F7]|uniref:malto-oligosyltrehalose synthase n=1 Tax=Propionimicrobium sp. BV2F7 TaxID=1111131 RepID=UPI0003D79AAF|nr:malto-oligosyltrehalose synthase [Propionimicrobium sp. BV2F7]ETJ97666.1 (1->4)-alpha-D-glucan 1-alpha-D-glucosylmutase [Propionimicrobium sp. BV2F7]